MKTYNARIAVRHFDDLENLAKSLGMSNPNGYEIYKQLHRLETKARRLTERMCNEYNIPEEESDRIAEQITNKIKQVFGGQLPRGFFINYDPRGSALKVKNDSFIHYKDWGDYGILAPEFD